MIYDNIVNILSYQFRLNKLRSFLWLYLTIFCLPTSADSIKKTACFSEMEMVNSLVKKWAPLVWLAPDDEFMPGSVAEFLENVHVENLKKSKFENNKASLNYNYNSNYGTLHDHPEEDINWLHKTKGQFPIDSIVDLPIGEHSKNSYLVSNENLENLLNNKTSFIYGRDPSRHSIPVYAIVRLCSSENSFSGTSDSEDFCPFKSKVKGNSKLNPNKNKAQNCKTNQRNSQNNPSGKNDLRYFINRLGVDMKQSDKGTGKYFPDISNFYNESKWKEMLNNDNIHSSISADQQKCLNKTDEQITIKYPKFHVTYWMFYPYNQGKELCTLDLGPFGTYPIPSIFGVCLGTEKFIGGHVGDWEHATLFFNGSPEPEEMYVAIHDAGAYYVYNKQTETFEYKSQEAEFPKSIVLHPEVPRTIATTFNHPILFSALGSHGLWTAPGTHRYVRVIYLYDINGFGIPWTTWNNVEIIYENNIAPSTAPAWVQYKGRWGNRKSKCHPVQKVGIYICEYSQGPPSVPRRPHFMCN